MVEGSAGHRGRNGCGVARRCRVATDLADRAGLTVGLSVALARTGVFPVHDRGRVLVDLAVMIADGGEALCDIDVLRHQGEVFGPVASDTTVWRALDEIGATQLRRIAVARAKVRARLWQLFGGPPAAQAAGRGIGERVVVLDVDSTILIAHSDKENAAATYKHTYGFHVREKAEVAELTGLLTLTGWPDGMRVIVRRERPHPGAQLTLFEERDGRRYTAFVTNTKAGALQWLEARHRAHARVEDRIRCAKDTGLRRLPSREFAINQAWCTAAAIAADLIAWLQIHALNGDLATAEPKRLRYRLLHTAARLTHGQRHRRLRIPATWPWATQLSAAFTRITAIPAPG